jgi:ParB-like chromosome segregation protein Spo0J
VKSFVQYINEATRVSVPIEKLVPWQEHHNEDAVNGYQKKIQRGKKIAPLKVIPHETQKDKYSIVDGHHRYLAHQREKSKNVEVVVYKNLASVPDERNR